MKTLKKENTVPANASIRFEKTSEAWIPASRLNNSVGQVVGMTTLWLNIFSVSWFITVTKNFNLTLRILMKNISAIILLVIAAAECGSTQNINWRSLNDSRQTIMQFTFGYDFGATAQVSYNRYIDGFRPIVVGLDYSLPMGNILLDDFKVRYGAQIEIAEWEGFSVTAKIYSNFRRHKTALVRSVTFGSDFAAVGGYFSRTWHAALEYGFDKSIISHFKHSDSMKENIPTIKDGWYIPTGGHHYYGIQGSKTLGDLIDLSLRIGATNAQFNDEDAVVPLYLQMGIGLRF